MPSAQPREPFVIGTDVWPGVAKLMEECGELVQVLGKLIAYPDGPHPDGGPDLRKRLHDELADVEAAITFLWQANGLEEYSERVHMKVQRFHGWHAEAMNRGA